MLALLALASSILVPGARDLAPEERSALTIRLARWQACATAYAYAHRRDQRELDVALDAFLACSPQLGSYLDAAATFEQDNATTKAEIAKARAETSESIRRIFVAQQRQAPN